MCRGNPRVQQAVPLPFFFSFFFFPCLFSCVVNHKVENTCRVSICLCGLLNLGVTGLQLCDRSLKALLLREVLQGPWDHKGYVTLSQV